MVRGSSLIKYIKAGGIYTSTGGCGRLWEAREAPPKTFYILILFMNTLGDTYIYRERYRKMDEMFPEVYVCVCVCVCV